MPIPTEEKLVAEAKKRLILKIGVVIFSVFILGFWAFNLAASFGRRSETDGTDSVSSTAWQNDLNQTISEIKSGLKANDSNRDDGKAFLKEMADNLEEKNSTATASETPMVATGTAVIASSVPATMTPIILKKELETNSSSSSATVSCPQFIDCMPTIGDSKPCVIPPGCENITQIAY